MCITKVNVHCVYYIAYVFGHFTDCPQATSLRTGRQWWRRRTDFKSNSTRLKLKSKKQFRTDIAYTRFLKNGSGVTGFWVFIFVDGFFFPHIFPKSLPKNVTVYKCCRPAKADEFSRFRPRGTLTPVPRTRCRTIPTHRVRWLPFAWLIIILFFFPSFCRPRWKTSV